MVFPRALTVPAYFPGKRKKRRISISKIKTGRVKLINLLGLGTTNRSANRIAIRQSKLTGGQIKSLGERGVQLKTFLTCTIHGNFSKDYLLFLKS